MTTFLHHQHILVKYQQDRGQLDGAINTFLPRDMEPKYRISTSEDSGNLLSALTYGSREYENVYSRWHPPVTLLFETQPSYEASLHKFNLIILYSLSDKPDCLLKDLTALQEPIVDKPLTE
ncbi:hypothetical protein BDR06DRAFT_178208 [Suillus hirtellus]|nr:hypothetical protein BDR06DRAFT_178208 [Suillus hirtellus]